MPGLRPSRLSFPELVTLIESDYKINGRKSLDRLRQSIAHLRVFLGAFTAPEINPALFRSYTAKRQGQGAAASTIMKERAALSRMFSLAVADGTLHHKPALPRRS